LLAILRGGAQAGTVALSLCLGALVGLTFRGAIEPRLSSQRFRFLAAEADSHLRDLDRFAAALRQQGVPWAKGLPAAAALPTFPERGADGKIGLVGQGRSFYAIAAGWQSLQRPEAAYFAYFLSIRSLLLALKTRELAAARSEILFLLDQGLTTLSEVPSKARGTRAASAHLRPRAIRALALELFPDSVWTERAYRLGLGGISPGELVR
jgi:hypothetical protein